MTRHEVLELYRDRRASRARDKEARRNSLTWVAWARLVVFFAGVVMLWFAWETDRLSWPWLIVPLLAFSILVGRHHRLREAFLRAERAESFYARGIDRIEERWQGQGRTGETFLQSGHPYARDLDVFGRASLFELLATTESPWGEARLAEWLKGPAAADEVVERQRAVRELAAKVDLREAIAVERRGEEETVDAQALGAWASAPPVLTASWLRFVALVLGLASLSFAIAWLASWVSRTPALLVLAASGAFGMLLRERVRSVIGSVERPARDLTLLSVLLERYERETFSCPKLLSLQTALSAAHTTASVQIGRLNRTIELLDARRNQLFAPFAALALWGTQFSFALESWRKRVGSAVPAWLDAVSDLDALMAMGTYAFEHPDDSFPEITTGDAFFDAVELGHPLIPEGRLVRNDVRLGGERRLLVVSGSNMSGKSTLLRSIGVGTVLALAGAPVRARSLVVSPLVVAASIRIEDSLQDGISHFYAEILRLRQVMELASQGSSVLFLLDEILHGTNSHDRRIGAEAVVRGLVDRGAIGLITTHDLALSRLAETMNEKAANVHFQDQIEEGKIRFDYKMRDGVVKKSNALALMRSVGLEV
ncbi:MAG TPA: DNA mismatch repair protein MutS [Vicinamibacteria bacterium]|nr:DNA mismatch repair protein MutS [Vicinamibacteria bacterium]